MKHRIKDILYVPTSISGRSVSSDPGIHRDTPFAAGFGITGDPGRGHCSCSPTCPVWRSDPSGTLRYEGCTGEESGGTNPGRTGELGIALVGQPNSGKSTLFNTVAGYRSVTANFPPVTVH